MSRERGITCIAFGLGGDAASAFGRLAPTCAMRGTRFELANLYRTAPSTLRL
jgi:hypothetical protein